MSWRNRITGSGEADPAQLRGNEKDWRTHPKLQQDTLAGALDEIGWIQDVIVNKRNSPEWGESQHVETLLDGHLRVELALRKGERSVPVKYVDLSPAEERLALATFDPVSTLASADADALEVLLRDIHAEDARLVGFLKQLAETEGLLPPEVEFPEYDETVAEGVELCICEKCGHEHSNKNKR